MYKKLAKNPQTVYNEKSIFLEGGPMNFYDKRVKRIIAVLVLVIIVAMIATSVIPYLL